jgi:hypothetical protein
MFPKLARVSNDKYEEAVNVEWKGYITVDIARNPRATNVYWQLVDPVFSLLELGFEHPSGRLMNCAVPLFNGEVEDREIQSLPQATQGTPFFDLAPWLVNVSNPAARANHLEQSGRIRLTKKHGGLSIICKDSPTLRSVLYGEKLICEFGEGDELVALTLVGDFPL